MATCSEPKSKPLCKYGSSCYRKNKEHLRQYAHPQKESVEVLCMGDNKLWVFTVCCCSLVGESEGRRA